MGDGPIDPSARTGRSDAVDFWRGFVLCNILITHMPGNWLESVTIRNIGFSDSAEAFVFISGLSLQAAYGRRVMTGQGSVVASLARRAIKLYGVHIALSLAGLAIFAIGARLADDPALMRVHGRDLFLDDPVSGLVGLVSLGHQLGYFNILPMYLVLIAMVPALFWLARSGSRLMLGVSLALYAASRAYGWNVPSWPMRGEWFLDPFTWQFMMALGIVAGRWVAPLPRDARLILVAVAVVAAAAVVVTDGLGQIPGLMERVRPWVDINKTALGTGRVIHFVALAYLIGATNLTRYLRRAPLFGAVASIGRGGLWSFATISLLAASGQVVAAVIGHSAASDLAFVLAALLLVHRVASMTRSRYAAPARTLPLSAAR